MCLTTEIPYTAEFLLLKYTVCIGFCFFLCRKVCQTPTAPGERATSWMVGGGGGVVSVPVRVCVCACVWGRQGRKRYLCLGTD